MAKHILVNVPGEEGLTKSTSEGRPAHFPACFGAFRTCHGPVGLSHILLGQDEADQADASVHQPHQEAGEGEHLVAGREGSHVTKEHLKKQT